MKNRGALVCFWEDIILSWVSFGQMQAKDCLFCLVVFFRCFCSRLFGGFTLFHVSG